MVVCVRFHLLSFLLSLRSVVLSEIFGSVFLFFYSKACARLACLFIFIASLCVFGWCWILNFSAERQTSKKSRKPCTHICNAILQFKWTGKTGFPLFSIHRVCVFCVHMSELKEKQKQKQKQNIQSTHHICDAFELVFDASFDRSQSISHSVSFGCSMCVCGSDVIYSVPHFAFHSCYSRNSFQYISRTRNMLLCCSSWIYSVLFIDSIELLLFLDSAHFFGFYFL